MAVAEPRAGIEAELAALHRRRGVKWSAHPPDVVAAWIADMDLEVAAPIREYIARAAHSSDLGYPPRLDGDPLPEVFCQRMLARFGWSPDPARVELLGDVVQGLYIALECYARRGDGVLIQTPIYPPFLAAAAETGRRAVTVPLVAGAGGFELDVDATAEAAARARVLMLCNPHNPTGRVLRRAELEALAEIALAHDLVVLADEIHADLVYRGQRHIPFASLGPEIAERTVTFNSATKAFNTAGVRCAVAHFGSVALQRRFNRLPRRIRGGLGILATEVTRLAWTECAPWLADTLARLEDNRDRLAERLARDFPGLVHHRPEATYLAWIDCRGLGLEPDPAAFFLRRARVALEDGARFGEPGRGWVRLNFATSPVMLEEILDRLEGALASR